MIASIEQPTTAVSDWLDELGLTKVKEKAISDIKQKSIEATVSWAAEHPLRVRIATAFAVIEIGRAHV